MTCPVCRASNDASVATCRRCKADLTLVAAVEARRAATRREAVASLLNRDFAAAWRAYRRAVPA